MATSGDSIEGYLEQLDPTSRRVISQLRELIRAAVPDGEECISYGMPAMRLDGHLIVAYASAREHFGLHIGAHPIEAHRAQLSAYDTSKGAVRFRRGDPIPKALVTMLVETRVAERGGRPPRKR